MNEITGISSFIYQRLAADATLTTLLTRGTPPRLNLYRDKAPQDATYPFVVIRFLSGVDVNALPVTQRIMLNVLFLIEAYTDQPNTIVLDQIADRVDEVLIGADGAVSAHGITVHGIYRQQPTFLLEEEGDRTYYRLGGEYRSVVSRL